jgi:hypothetical protein
LLEKEIKRRTPIFDLVGRLRVYQSCAKKCDIHSRDEQWARFILALPSKFDKRGIFLESDW